MLQHSESTQGHCPLIGDVPQHMYYSLDASSRSTSPAATQSLWLKATVCTIAALAGCLAYAHTAPAHSHNWAQSQATHTAPRSPAAMRLPLRSSTLSSPSQGPRAVAHAATTKSLPDAPARRTALAGAHNTALPQSGPALLWLAGALLAAAGALVHYARPHPTGSFATLAAADCGPIAMYTATGTPVQSQTQRIMEEMTSRQQQATGAGGATTYEALQRADKIWKGIREMPTGDAAGPAPQFVREVSQPLGVVPGCVPVPFWRMLRNLRLNCGGGCGCGLACDGACVHACAGACLYSTWSWCGRSCLCVCIWVFLFVPACVGGFGRACRCASAHS